MTFIIQSFGMFELEILNIVKRLSVRTTIKFDLKIQICKRKRKINRKQAPIDSFWGVYLTLIHSMRG